MLTTINDEKYLIQRLSETSQPDAFSDNSPDYSENKKDK
jgi:hypothetical protein